MFCKKCGKEIGYDDKYCPNCGSPVGNELSVQNDSFNSERRNDYICCPKCGSTNIHFVTRDTSTGFNAENACCGYMLCGPIGLLCGVDNDRKVETVRKCMNCNHEF